MRTRLLIVLVLLSAAWSGAAKAFPFSKFMHMPAAGEAGINRAGSAGIYGTGGKQDHGIKCSSCHIKGKGQIDVSIVPSPAWQDVGGQEGYKPGQKYDITINLLNEHLHSTANDDNNGFGFTIEDAAGKLSGVLQSSSGQTSSSCPATDPFPTNGNTAGQNSVMYGDCHGIMHLPHPAASVPFTKWTFTWTAPAAGKGDLTMFVGVVDGDTGGESSLKDDTVERTIPLKQGS
jgi:hypothetical protein